MPPTVARILADFATASGRVGDDALRATAVRHILDTVGCGLAAIGLDEGGHAARVALAGGGTPEATVLGTRTRVPAAAAAFANGTRCHALDFDDTHEAGICHVSAVVAPAALAVGEALGRSGAEVVDAYLTGSEIALRIAVAAAPGLYARGFHPTSVCGAFGAAAATARLRGLAPDETVSALGIVGSLASGLLEFLSDGSSTKPLHAGWSAQAGVQAAALAAAGATGPATVIEGRFGLLSSHADGGAPELQLGDLGERWEAAEVAIKPYPACHFAHAATWAVAQLRVAPEDVEAIDARIPAEGLPLVLDPIAAKREPRTSYDAKFSLPFTIAHQLRHGDVGLQAFTPERIRDPELLALARRVGGGAWDGAPSRFAAAVTVTMRDGGERRLAVPHTPGSPRNPLPAEQVLRKYRSNAALAEVDPAVVDRLPAMDGPEPIRLT